MADSDVLKTAIAVARGAAEVYGHSHGGFMPTITRDDAADVIVRAKLIILDKGLSQLEGTPLITVAAALASLSVNVFATMPGRGPEDNEAAEQWLAAIAEELNHDGYRIWKNTSAARRD